MHITMDFETRSPVPIRDTGAWIYAINPSTQPICLCYSLDEDDKPKVWIPEWVNKLIKGESWYGTLLEPTAIEEIPEDLKETILQGAEVEAHNAFFERAIWDNIMVPRFGWPEIKREQWRCSAAKAAACAIPRSLDGATSVLGVAKKDNLGKQVMMKLCKPRKVIKAERTSFKERDWVEQDDYGWITPEGETLYFWHQDPYDLLTTIDYCKQDVVAERALSQGLPELHKKEIRVWQVDQDINFRGIHIDEKMVRAAIDLSAHFTSEATKEAREISGKAFKTLRQLKKISNWLASEGVEVPNMQAKTIKELLAGELPENVRTVLECVKLCAKSSIKKYQKMIQTADPRDMRVRDFLRYHGASTGRWTGKFVQTQNLPRGKMKDPDTMCGIIRNGDPDLLNIFYGPTAPTSILSWAIRGAICAPPGRDLICADYSGVEARGLLWLVGDEDGLEIFKRREGEPGIYREMAGDIYNIDPRTIDKKDPKGSDMRQMGKQAILGLGYGMGWKTFIRTCEQYGMEVSTKFSKHVVSTYRKRFEKVPAGWKQIEKAAISAVISPGQVFKSNRVAFKKEGQFLMCKLPSGRKLYYFKPLLIDDFTPWGDPTKKLTYMTTEGKGWGRVETYGGKLVENIVQALCRDLEAAAIVRVELKDNPYDVIMHTHDEVVAEVDEGEGSLEEFEKLISVLPKWAKGFPLSAEGWRGKRYRK